MIKKGQKVHLGSSLGSFPKSACGVPYPEIQTKCFFWQVNCKRCKRTYEYRADVEAKKDIAYEQEGK